ncbi:MAG: hypothetical protein WCE87_01870 [Candidatus Udaeobacter sp.]
MPATPISQEAIYSTLYATLALTDSIFQIWITLTFAVLIATYVAERRFDRALYRLVSGLYAFASVILFVRFASAAYQAFHYKNLLRARGFEPWPVPNVVSLIIGMEKRERIALMPAPKHAMEPTASRRNIQLHMRPTQGPVATRAVARLSSSCSRQAFGLSKGCLCPGTV